jgi:hypothetical protein
VLLSELAAVNGAGSIQSWQQLSTLPAAQRDQVLLDLFFLTLRDAGRARPNPKAIAAADFAPAFAAIQSLFGLRASSGDISLTSREIKTTSGGNISLLAPAGKLEVGLDLATNQSLDQGILTEDGGNIAIFARGDVDLGTSRVFTLRGGNVIIWSSVGNIAAGASGKSVAVAPPTRVVIDPQSADTRTDLSGLATGGGIGVLESVAGVPPGDVDLIAPAGSIDAGDAGIRSSRNITLSAVRILNTDNILSPGTVTGLPAPLVVTVNIAGLAAASQAAGALVTMPVLLVPPPPVLVPELEQDLPSVITVEVEGFDDGPGSEEERDP